MKALLVLSSLAAALLYGTLSQAFDEAQQTGQDGVSRQEQQVREAFAW